MTAARAQVAIGERPWRSRMKKRAVIREIQRRHLIDEIFVVAWGVVISRPIDILNVAAWRSAPARIRRRDWTAILNPLIAFGYVVPRLNPLLRCIVRAVPRRAAADSAVAPYIRAVGFSPIEAVIAPGRHVVRDISGKRSGRRSYHRWRVQRAARTHR